jgi:hypothetical protein
LILAEKKDGMMGVGRGERGDRGPIERGKPGKPGDEVGGERSEPPRGSVGY